jgi:hypothetical protein
VDIDVVGANAPAPDAAGFLPYGCPILQQGRCSACGATFERRMRVDGWAPWFADGDDATWADDGAASATSAGAQTHRT